MRDLWPVELLADSDEIPGAVDAVLAAYLETSQRPGIRAYIRAEIKARRLAQHEIKRLQAVVEAAKVIYVLLEGYRWTVQRSSDREMLDAMATFKARVDAMRSTE